MNYACPSFVKSYEPISTSTCKKKWSSSIVPINTVSVSNPFQIERYISIGDAFEEWIFPNSINKIFRVCSKLCAEKGIRRSNLNFGYGWTDHSSSGLSTTAGHPSGRRSAHGFHNRVSGASQDCGILHNNVLSILDRERKCRALWDWNRIFSRDQRHKNN